jgi:hypothetical protein
LSSPFKEQAMHRLNNAAQARPPRQFVWLLIVLLAVLPIAGCGGCMQDPIEAQKAAARKEAEEKLRKLEEERKKREKPKPDFEIGRFMTQPNSLSVVESMIKPGHWTSATVEITANNYDFLGDMVTDPFDLDDMPFRLGTSRPVTLAKGQRKFLELTYYVPPGRKGQRVRTRLLSRGDRELAAAEHPMLRMPEHQFYFIVLARDPDRYNLIRDLDSVRPPSGKLVEGAADFYYRVMQPRIENRTPLPSNPLCWTSIAYVLWDDLHPDSLSPEQQQAMLDWIHWGGQLIVSGPGTLENLKGSFLEPYLPATAKGPWEITADTLAELNRTWSIHGPPLKPANPWSGVQLEPHAEAKVLVAHDDSPLVLERSLGYGRIVLSAFRLGQRELTDWRSFDNFFNGLVLRRDPRQFRLGSDGFEVEVNWADSSHTPNPAPAMARRTQLRFRQPNPDPLASYDDDPGWPERMNPARVARLHYYTRDTEVPDAQFEKEYRLPQMAAEFEQQPQMDYVEAMRLARQALAAISGQEPPESIGAGLAGWSDNNAVARLARASLTGGIVIPDASFVVWVLGLYLLILVPVNWAVFRALGRVEWAWIAAPIITIGFAAAVVRLAQLDVGFVRTKSEIGVMEIQAGYPRAHMTRYTSLYTSLSTTYDLRFADPSALVQPFPTRGELLKEQSRATVNYRRDQGGDTEATENFPIKLDGFDVNSNTQAMLHSEHMFELGGDLKLEQLENGLQQVVNNTHLTIEGAGVIGPEGLAWIGTLRPGASAALNFQPWAEEPVPADESGEISDSGSDDKKELRKAEPWIDQREQSPATASKFPPEVLSIRQMVRLAQNTTRPDEIRLVGWTTEEIAGVRIEPEASQSRHANVIVAHLRQPPAREPKPDLNARAQVEKEDTTNNNDNP